MAHAAETTQSARQLYVYERLSLSGIADRLKISEATIRAWKRKAANRGDDWDKARAAARMAAGGLGDLTAQVLEEFATLFQSTITDLKQSNADPIERVEAISRLSDAYAKTVKAAGASDAKFSKLAVALEVLQLLGQHIQARHPEAAPTFLELIEPFGQHLTEHYG